MDDFYLLKASTDFRELEIKAEECLRKLGYSFIVNRTQRVAEFEMSAPAYFRVVVEKRGDPQVRNVMMVIPPSISSSKGSTIDVRFDIEESPGSASRSLAKSSAVEFLKALAGDLHAKPWEGLGFRESRREKKKWLDIIT